jgi:hypothetical protein
VRVKAGPTAVTVAGVMLAIVGRGWLMVNIEPAELPLTFVTVTLAVPI